MIQSHLDEHPISRLMKYGSSRVAKMRELMDAKEFRDDDFQIKGRPSWRQQETIERETQEAIDLIASGESLGFVARSIGVKVGTIQTRLRSRGLTVGKIRKGAK